MLNPGSHQLFGSKLGSKRSKIVSVDHQLVQEAKINAEDTKFPYSWVTFALNFVRNLTQNALKYKHQWILRNNCGCWVTEPWLWTTMVPEDCSAPGGRLAQIREGLNLVLLNVFRVSADLTHGVHATILILRQRVQTHNPAPFHPERRTSKR